ncbi:MULTISPECIES: isochorismate synthase MenF [unclassified Arthrobacter]|uniref:isochorismate synthase n=1 Tax=unclassified Arthrobacter TaxID=235627 RepID=UPI001D13825B|nr:MULTISPECIES: isochorismate synthase [unclassified Arthrobacter]MCC3290156.1 isochorismate synthase [Arthrobacter sp. zg-Y1110]MCC3300333.1 isochorismate synthase [Arthrobacter sp. zg-Y895]UWX84456.1 isochorismate synthase [Arthrobacter sp. zg-Y1110]
MTTLRSVTVPVGELSAAMGLLEYLVLDEQLCWIRRQEGLVGFGEAARFTSSGPERFARAQDWWRSLLAEADVEDPLAAPGTGIVAFGSFAFSKRSPFESRLVVPEIIVGLRDGAGWVTYTTADPEAELNAETAKAALARYLDDLPLYRESDPADRVLPGMLSESEWKNAVARSVAHVAAGDLSKIVLARDVAVELGSPLVASQVLRELAVRYRDCWTYSVDGLIGSTPEMLIKVENGTAEARVLAGTLDRATAPADDPHYAKRVLAGSAKQQHEHQIAIDSLTRSLEPFTSSMTSHTEPFVLELPNVWHLASDVTAELARDAGGLIPTPLTLVEALHPTAAVCGFPTSVAGELISELEHMDRGPYSGPVGWMDAAGNGEWGIALRGAVIESPTEVRLYAGCGIVAGSNPAAELEETWSKFRPMLEALGLDRPRAVPVRNPDFASSPAGS